MHDLDQMGDDDLPICAGKLDLHYTEEGTYGTLLLWQDSCTDIESESLDVLIQELVGGFAEPMGVSGEYVIEHFAPPLDSYRVYSNIEE